MATAGSGKDAGPRGAAATRGGGGCGIGWRGVAMGVFGGGGLAKDETLRAGLSIGWAAGGGLCNALTGAAHSASGRGGGATFGSGIGGLAGREGTLSGVDKDGCNRGVSGIGRLGAAGGAVWSIGAAAGSVAG